MVSFFTCYNFNKEWLLVEMVLNRASSEIDWASMVVPDAALDKAYWQCPYMEQYLNSDGTEKICETYHEPAEAVKPCRVAFFIYKNGAQSLQTPYGDFELSNIQMLPERLEKIIEFEAD